jgi:hypothetical protein
MTAQTPEQIRQITKAVLARPEFSPAMSWTDLVIQQIVQWLRELARWSGRNPDLARLLVIALTIILAVLIVHIAYTVIAEYVSLRKGADSQKRKQPLRALEGVAENWTDAFRLARAALDENDLYKAIWITHRILLSILDRSGSIRFARWKTNTDYIRECKDAGEIAATLSELTAAYECVVYAHDDLDRSLAAALLGKVQELAAKAGA